MYVCIFGFNSYTYIYINIYYREPFYHFNISNIDIKEQESESWWIICIYARNYANNASYVSPASNIEVCQLGRYLRRHESYKAVLGGGLRGGMGPCDQKIKHDR